MSAAPGRACQAGRSLGRYAVGRSRAVPGGLGGAHPGTRGDRASGAQAGSGAAAGPRHGLNPRGLRAQRRPAPGLARLSGPLGKPLPPHPVRPWPVPALWASRPRLPGTYGRRPAARRVPLWAGGGRRAPCALQLTHTRRNPRGGPGAPATPAGERGAGRAAGLPSGPGQGCPSLPTTRPSFPTPVPPSNFQWPYLPLRARGGRGSPPASGPPASGWQTVTSRTVSTATAQSGACLDGELGAAVARSFLFPQPPAACALPVKERGGHGATTGSGPAPTVELVPARPWVPSAAGQA